MGDNAISRVEREELIDAVLDILDKRDPPETCDWGELAAEIVDRLSPNLESE